jgi:phosphate transport system permease protein
MAAADQPILRVDPPTQTVAPGQQFSVNVIQKASIATTGAQVNVTYDPGFIQLKDFELGPAYTSANAIFVFGNADFGTNANKSSAIARANKFGTLENVSGFLLPGSGTIPAGDNVFLKLTFVGKANSGGPTNLGLGNGSMIDQVGQPLDPTLVIGRIVVGASGAPAASGSAGASSGASSGPTPSPSESTEAIAAPVNPTTPVKLSVAPTELTLEAGNTARVFIVADADGNISSAVADLAFDKDKLEITSLEAGPPWNGATVVAVAPGTNSGLDAAIAQANGSGVLQAAGAFFAPGTQDLPYGQGVVVSVLVKAKTRGTSNLSIGNASALGVSGETIDVVVDQASLTKPPAKGIDLDPTLVIPLVLLLVLVISGVILVRLGRVPIRVRRRWPYYLSLGLGLIPVVLFAMLVVVIVVNAAPVVNNPGLGALFGGTFTDPKGNVVTGYAILPPLWGTILITTIATVVGLPVSLALAISAVDFPMGPIGRIVRPAVGILSGLPPIVYAVSVPVFVSLFMIPKFAANMDYSAFQNGGPAAVGADAANWPPADVPYSAGGFPWDPTGPNSALLGGVLVGLFLIPFLTPIFVDALRNVPRAAREGSLALGANRTYTLRRVVLPQALPALTGGATLGILKAMGDAVIVLFAVGFAADMPNPPLDVLERTSSLGAWGANLIGSFETLSASCIPQSCAVGYTSAFVLLVVATLVVLAMTFLQGRHRRRLAA